MAPTVLHPELLRVVTEVLKGIGWGKHQTNYCINVALRNPRNRGVSNSATQRCGAIGVGTLPPIGAEVHVERTELTSPHDVLHNRISQPGSIQLLL